MSASEPTDTLLTFSGEFIRLLVGVIALAFPVIIWLVSGLAPLDSISASYYTGARNLFVGLLFVLGAILFVYKGRCPWEPWIAKVGALAPIVAALFPTLDTTNQLDTNVTRGTIHLMGGAVMFAVAAYFCLVPFRRSASQKPGAEARRRLWIYTVCGSVIIVVLLVLGISSLKLIAPIIKIPNLTYIGEWVMLWAFGLAWMVAAKFLPWVTADEERRHLRAELGNPTSGPVEKAPVAAAPAAQKTM